LQQHYDDQEETDNDVDRSDQINHAILQ
jgi:hypothetical protein